MTRTEPVEEAVVESDHASPDDDVVSLTDLASEDAEVGALEVLRRGIRVSPELKRGAAFTVFMALASAIGKLVIPILIQQILDRGLDLEAGVDTGFVYAACAIATAIILAVFFAARLTYLRLVNLAESVLLALRVRTFDHIHRLSLADHTEAKKGVLTARVTSDVETLAQFTQWGAVAWIIDSVMIIGTFSVMAVYSWQLTLVTIVVYAPMIPILSKIQQRQFHAYGEVRSRVGDTMGAASEAVSGAAVVRAYDYGDNVGDRLEVANLAQFNSQRHAFKFFAWLAPLSDGFSSLALSSVIAVGVWWGPEMGMSSGELVAFLFLVTILINPITEIGEILDQTQTALAGWWKILQVLEVPIEIHEPDPGVELPGGALSVEATNLHFSYRTGGPVLRGIDVSIPAGTNVAIVGETGSGKTTFAKLLARFADATEGNIEVGGVDLRDIAVESRHRTVRMVPQDGFLFDETVGYNVTLGRPEATPAEVYDAFDRLGLRPWLDRLPDGLDTQVGERGEHLSVGERQLVALARAQLADPGVLILDEATSAVDPETEVALTAALSRLAEGRTTISIAHRLSTAERSDLVLVFDHGLLVEQGSHADLVVGDGIYAGLYDSWIGNTR